MNGRKTELKPGMIFQPSLRLFARMRGQVFKQEQDAADGCFKAGPGA
jgi:hypothetical protein